MKIELVKEEKYDMRTIYYTQINGKFVEGSLAFDEEKARAAYEHLAKVPSLGTPVITVLDSVEK